MDDSDKDFLLQLDGCLEGVTPLTQDPAQDEAPTQDQDQPEDEKLLASDVAEDLSLGLDQDLDLQHQQEQQQQEEQHQQQEQQQQEQENQQDFSINDDVE